MIRALILLCALLASCGGGGSSAPPVPAPVPDVPVETVLFRQVGTPIIINDPGSVSEFPLDTGYLVSFDTGRQSFTWDGSRVGIVNDSWTAPDGSSWIKTVNYQWTPSQPVKPWLDGNNNEVCTDFKIAVPSSFKKQALGNYTGLDLWLQDGSTGKPTSGKSLILSVWVFDDGRVVPTDSGPWDYPGLKAVQFRGPIGAGKLYRTTSGVQHQEPFSEPQPFGFCVSRDQVLFMLAASVGMLGGMPDIHDMTVHQAEIASETALPGPSSQDRSKPGATLTTYFSDWTVTIKGSKPWPATSTSPI